MMSLMLEVTNKLNALYIKDLNGEQRYVKSASDIDTNIKNAFKKMGVIETELKTSGRMKNFLKSFGIKAKLQDSSEIPTIIMNDISTHGRYHEMPIFKLIDADGRVYNMTYTHFFPTEIQLNVSNKTPTPLLANIDEHTITSDMINRPEVLSSIRKVFET